MNKYLTTIYLVLVIAISLLIFAQTRYAGKSSSDAGQIKGEFKTLAAKLKATKTAYATQEKLMAALRIDEEYERTMLVPAGDFVMGTETGHWTEQPERNIFLDSFHIDKYEVTFAQYYVFVRETAHRKPRLAGYLGIDTQDLPKLMNPFGPVVGVSWDDAQSYCVWKGKRLPSEAEWEKAAKGRSQRTWVWGEEKVNFANLKGAGDGTRYTAPVGAFQKDRSPFGVHDMTGNVMEWVADWYREDYYGVMPEKNPLGPSTGGDTAHYREQRVIRGGSWNDTLYRAHTTTRFKMDPIYRDVTIGFRCAKSA